MRGDGSGTAGNPLGKKKSASGNIAKSTPIDTGARTAKETKVSERKMKPASRTKDRHNWPTIDDR